jgi:hypothetical protein
MTPTPGMITGGGTSAIAATVAGETSASAFTAPGTWATAATVAGVATVPGPSGAGTAAMAATVAGIGVAFPRATFFLTIRDRLSGRYVVAGIVETMGDWMT